MRDVALSPLFSIFFCLNQIPLVSNAERNWGAEAKKSPLGT